MTIPQAHQVDHLLLTVGSNPLPIYVTARVYAAAGCRAFTLIVTEQTLCIAGYIQAQLHADGCGSVALCPVNGFDTADILQKVRACIAAIPNNQRIGVNYTGGTTPMGVHTYEAAQASGRNVRFSYLDGSRCELVCWTAHDPRTPIPLIRPQRRLELSFDTLYMLHDLQLTSQRNSLLPHTVAALAALHCEGEQRQQQWERWIDLHLLRVPQRPDPNASDIDFANWWFDALQTCRRWRPNGQIRVPHELDAAFPAVAAGLCADLNAAALPPLLSDLRTAINGRIGAGWQAEYLGKWFEGLWLESHVFDALNRLQTAGRVNDVVRNAQQDHDGLRFEIDVACVVGYQLFGISCTTEYRSQQAKLKLFEAAQRIRRIGGDEARIGVVTMLNPQAAQTTERQLAALLDRSGIVKVFGRDQLCQLDQALQGWIAAG